MCFSVCPDAFVHLLLKLALLSCCLTQTLMLALLLSKARLNCSVMLLFLQIQDMLTLLHKF